MVTSVNLYFPGGNQRGLDQGDWKMASYSVSSAPGADTGFLVLYPPAPPVAPAAQVPNGGQMVTSKACGSKFGLQVCVFLTQTGNDMDLRWLFKA